MDHLEQLKKQWNTRESNFTQYSTAQLSGFIAKRSSSIVKWIFYIALLEFAFFSLLGFFLSDNESQQHTKEITGNAFYYGSFILHYVVVAIFIVLFYRNYKHISALQPTRSLMKNILKTRRTMKWYIWYNLIYIMLFTVILSVFTLINDPIIADMTQKMHVKNMTTFNVGFVAVAVVFAAVFCAILYGFYSLIYGILLRKLRANYEELRKIEV